MKRTVICLSLIVVFVALVVILDIWFVSVYVDGFNQCLDQLDQGQTYSELSVAAERLSTYFHRKSFWAHRIVPTGRLEELETLITKLNAYIEVHDIHETRATSAELRARVNLLYSTGFYRWYQSSRLSIG